MAINRAQQIGPLPPAARANGMAPVRTAGGQSFQEALQNVQE